MGIQDIAIYGVPVVILIPILVEVLKKVGWIKGDWAILTAVILGVGLLTCVKLASIFPVFDEWFAVIFLGAVVGLSSCGVYDGAKAVIIQIKGVKWW